MKILLVDDTRSIHLFTKNLLTRISQFEIHDVYNGEEALQFLKNDQAVDLVLLDWEMPVMDGYSTLVRIRESYKDLPVIMVTTKNTPDQIMKMLDAGASEYMMKPFTEDILKQKMMSVLGGKLEHAG